MQTKSCTKNVNTIRNYKPMSFKSPINPIIHMNVFHDRFRYIRFYMTSFVFSVFVIYFFFSVIIMSTLYSYINILLSSRKGARFLLLLNFRRRKTFRENNSCCRRWFTTGAPLYTYYTYFYKFIRNRRIRVRRMKRPYTRIMNKKTIIIYICVYTYLYICTENKTHAALYTYNTKDLCAVCTIGIKRVLL